jgi:hypothetical protein
MNIALKIHSFIGILLGLLFFYAPTTWYFVLISAYLIAWGLLTCCFIDKKAYHIYIKILVYIAAVISVLALIFSSFAIFSTVSSYLSNILIYLFLFFIFILSWSIISLLSLKRSLKSEGK